MSDATPTSDRSTGRGWNDPTLSSGDSPASPSASRARTEVQKTIATCGPRPTVPFASYDPATFSWRTSQASLLTGTLGEYSETWPKAGTMRSGTLLRLRKSEHRTAASASSSWPTPDTMGAMSGENQRTPAYGSHAVSLHHKVAWWDTPKASSDKGGPNQRDGNGRLYLDAQARQWPTPAASDVFPYTEAEANRRSPDLPTTASLQAPTTETPGHECSPKCRRLNPLFVEWLQGFPIGHTALKH